ncbi:uncharacterized protein alms1 [Eucyclogobius newberryi]|uniref:uncharacterized protein alms1 n=1 Tax=Eucyclogobius newberryi TaxID=166745 RepID=UPI003B5BA280
MDPLQGVLSDEDSKLQDQRQQRVTDSRFQQMESPPHFAFQESNLSPALSLVPSYSGMEHNTDSSLFRQSDMEFAPLRAYPDMSVASERFQIPLHEFTSQTLDQTSLSQHPLASEMTVLSEEAQSSCGSLSQHSLSPKSVNIREEHAHLAPITEEELDIVSKVTFSSNLEKDTYFLNKDVPAQKLLQILQKDVGVPSSSSNSNSSTHSSKKSETKEFKSADKPHANLIREGPPGEASVSQHQPQSSRDSYINESKTRFSDVFNVSVGPRCTKPDDSSEDLLQELLDIQRRNSQESGEAQNKTKGHATPFPSRIPKLKDSGNENVSSALSTGPISTGIPQRLRQLKEHDLWSSGNQTGIDGSYLGFLPQSQSTPGIFKTPSKSNVKSKFQQLSDIKSPKESSVQTSTDTSAPFDSAPFMETKQKSGDEPTCDKVQSLPSLNYMQKVDAWRANQSSGKSSLFDSLALKGFTGVSPKKKAYDAVSDSLNRILSQQVVQTSQNVAQNPSTDISASSSPRREEAVGSAPSDNIAITQSASPFNRSQSHSSLSTVVMSVKKEQATESRIEKSDTEDVDIQNQNDEIELSPVVISLGQFSDVTLSNSQDSSNSGQKVATSIGTSSVSLEVDNYDPYWTAKLSTPPPQHKPRELNIEERIPVYLKNLGINQSPSTILTPFSPRGPIREPEFSPSELGTIKGSTPTKSIQPSEGGTPHKAEFSRSSLQSMDSSMSIDFTPLPPSTEVIRQDLFTPVSSSSSEASAAVQSDPKLHTHHTEDHSSQQQRNSIQTQVNAGPSLDQEADENLLQQGSSTEQNAENSFVSSGAFSDIRMLLSQAEAIVSPRSSTASDRFISPKREASFASAFTTEESKSQSSPLWTRSSSDSVLTARERLTSGENIVTARQSGVVSRSAGLSLVLNKSVQRAEPEGCSAAPTDSVPPQPQVQPPPPSVAMVTTGTIPEQSKEASQETSPEASQEASRQASQEASQEASRQASLEASRQASLQASQEASRQASRQASLQASQEASRQASRQASLQASQEASRQASLEDSRQASLEDSQETSQNSPVQSTTSSPIPVDSVSSRSSESSLAFRVAKLLQSESPATMVSSTSSVDQEESRAREWIKQMISGQNCEPLELDPEDRRRIEEIKRELLLKNPKLGYASTETESSAASSLRDPQGPALLYQTEAGIYKIKKIQPDPSKNLCLTVPLLNAPQREEIIESKVREIAAREGVNLPKTKALTSITISTSRRSTSPTPSTSPAPPRSPSSEPLHSNQLTIEEDNKRVSTTLDKDEQSQREERNEIAAQSPVLNQNAKPSVRQDTVGGHHEFPSASSMSLEQDKTKENRSQFFTTAEITESSRNGEQVTAKSGHVSQVRLLLSPKPVDHTASVVTRDVNFPRKHFIPLRHSPSTSISPDEGVGLSSPPEWQEVPKSGERRETNRSLMQQQRVTSAIQVSPKPFAVDSTTVHLLPYKPSGSEELFYVPQTEADTSNNTSMESTHTGSDDARPPHFSSDVLGHQDPGLDRGVTIRHAEGIYSKRPTTPGVTMSELEHRAAVNSPAHTPKPTSPVSPAFTRVPLPDTELRPGPSRDQGTSPISFLTHTPQDRAKRQPYQDHQLPPPSEHNISNLDQLWRRFSERRRDEEESRAFEEREVSLLERLERLSRIIHRTQDSSTSELETSNQEVHKSRTVGDLRELKRQRRAEKIHNRSETESRYRHDSDNLKRWSEAEQDVSADTVSSASMSTVDTARLIRAFGAERVQRNLKSSSSLSKLYSAISKQKEQEQEATTPESSTNEESSVVVDSVSSACTYTPPLHRGPSKTLVSKKAVKQVSKGIQTGDLEIVSNGTRRHTRDVGTTFPSPGDVGRSSSSSSLDREHKTLRGASSKTQKHKKSRHNGPSKRYPHGVSWFISAEELKAEAHKENEPEERRPSTAWFEPASTKSAWREPLRQRLVQEQRNTPQTDTDPARKNRSSVSRVNLQDALLSGRPGFVSRSRRRLERLALHVEERRLQALFHQEREELFIQPGRPGRPPRPAVTAQLRRAVPRKEMIQRSKQIYETLPEVRRRKEEERRKAEYRSYRLNAQLYNKKITNHVLGKRLAWN